MDNESRYMNRRLTYFCRLVGIDLQTPTTFNPHKIDVVALRIHTLKSMASCMIQAKSLDPSLEVEAINSVSHIFNWSPHPALDGKTPFEAWCDRKLVVNHFRVFDCLAWENLSSRGCKAPIPHTCTFIRYEDRMKAYRLLDPKTHEIFVEKDIHFKESSPSLSSTPLRILYTVETHSDTSDHSLIDSNMWGSIDSCSERSWH